ncbi:hypothetical protein ES703_38097 [subsurface metagenome]
MNQVTFSPLIDLTVPATTSKTKPKAGPRQRPIPNMLSVTCRASMSSPLEGVRRLSFLALLALAFFEKGFIFPYFPKALLPRMQKAGVSQSLRIMCIMRPTISAARSNHPAGPKKKRARSRGMSLAAKRATSAAVPRVSLMLSRKVRVVT